MVRPRLWILDHNGTTLDDTQLAFECLQEICRVLDIKSPTIDAWRGGNASSYMRYYRSLGVPEEVTSAQLNTIRELYYVARLHRARFRDGVDPFLRACRQRGLKLAVCSGEIDRLLHLCLQRDQMEQLYDSIHPDAVPKSEHLAAICRELDVELPQAVYVDDSVDGVTTAYKLGMVAVAFASRTGSCLPDRLRREARYHHIVTNFAELQILMNRLSA